MNRYEQIYNFIWILLSILICYGSIKLGVWGPGGPSTGFLPFLTGLIIGVCGLTLFAFEWSKGSYKDTKNKFFEHPGSLKRLALSVVSFCVMAFLMPLLGFFLASLLVVTFLILLIEQLSVTRLIVEAFFCCIVVYLFFQYVLSIRLPMGILHF